MSWERVPETYSSSDVEIPLSPSPEPSEDNDNTCLKEDPRMFPFLYDGEGNST
jgi:hypothetical protein